MNTKISSCFIRFGALILLFPAIVMSQERSLAQEAFLSAAKAPVQIDSALIGYWQNVNYLSLFGMNVHADGNIDFLGIDFKTGTIAINPEGFWEPRRFTNAMNGSFVMKRNIQGWQKDSGTYTLRTDTLQFSFSVFNSLIETYVKTALGKSILHPDTFTFYGNLEHTKFEASQVSSTRTSRASFDAGLLEIYGNDLITNVHVSLSGVNGPGKYILGKDDELRYAIWCGDYSLGDVTNGSDTVTVNIDTLGYPVGRCTGTILCSPWGHLSGTNLQFSIPFRSCDDLVPIRIQLDNSITSGGGVVSIPLRYGIGADDGTFYASTFEIAYDTSLVDFVSMDVSGQLLDYAILNAMKADGVVSIETSTVQFHGAGGILATLQFRTKNTPDTMLTPVRIRNWLFVQDCYIPWLATSILTILPNTATTVEPIGAAVKCMLYQNNPNPFSNETTISFDAPAGTALLKVTDALGRIVKEFTQSIERPGRQSMIFDGAALPQGVYFFTLESKGESVTRRMVLQR